MITICPYRLRNAVQHYAWGMRGPEAFIPRLLGFAAEPGTPYAELWMGVHPKGPSEVLTDDGAIPLRDLLARHPQAMLGEAVVTRFGATLPFLFKVLSIREALSIQAHPTRAQAAVLHARDPQHYPDDNHKPEVAVALDELTALMGLKQGNALEEALHRYPEIATFAGEGEGTGTARRLLRRAKIAPSALDKAITHLAQRLTRSHSLREEERLFLTLRQKYTGPDVGLFMLLLMRLVHLRRGEAVFIRPGMPHAYLRGNIIECMANSDNVVRVGLTPKYKDTQALLEILDDAAQPYFITPEQVNALEKGYRPPVTEFHLRSWRIPAGEKAAIEGGTPRILLLLRGTVRLRWTDGETIGRQGESFFLPAALPKATIVATSAAELFAAEVPPPAETTVVHGQLVHNSLAEINAR